jgi:hypothetical protein
MTAGQALPETDQKNSTVSSSPWRRILGLLRRALLLLTSPLREALIDFEGLSLSLRLMAILGYVSVFVLLALTLLLESFSDRLYFVSYSYETDDAIVTNQVPFLVLLVSGLSFALGWAYILTGATDCRRRVFLPLAALFALQLILFFPAGNGMCVWACAAPAFLVLLVGSHFFTQTKKFWRDYPLVEFALWFCVLLFFLGLFWFSRQSGETLASDFSGIFSVFGLINAPLWFFFGLGLIDVAIDIGRAVVTTLRKLFPGEFLRALTVFLILVRPVVALFIFTTNQQDTLLGDTLLLDSLLAPLPLLALTAGLALARRWTTRSATIILALSFASPVFMAFIVPAVRGGEVSDLLDVLLGGLGIFPPLLLFVLLMAHSVLSLGVSFAEKDGQYIPRSGRILLGFGFALLVTGFTIFSVNVRDVSGQLDQSFQEATDAFFGLGVISLGLPYLLWILWRRRDRLAGKEEDLEGVKPLLAGLSRVPGWVWVVLGVVMAVFLACFVCLIGLIFFNPPPPA